MSFIGNHIKLISRVVTGNASKADASDLQRLIDMSDENKNEFQAYQNIWDVAAELSPKVEFDAEKSWSKMSTLISCVEEIPEEVVASSMTFSKPRKQIGYYLARVAAVFAVAFGLYFIFNQSPNFEIVTLASLDSPADSHLLPDGSSVTLNHESVLSFPEEFAASERLVDFQGEAFFEVAHNPEVPMIIQMENVRVKVLGTSFDLISLKDGKEVTLYLQTGKVLFYTIDPVSEKVLEQIVLLPGQKGVYNKTTGQISRENYAKDNFFAWKTGVLVFEKTPLSEVFEMLEKTYNIQISSPNYYQDYLLTATYDNETVESIFESLEIIFGVPFALDGQQVILQ